jgi:calcineurin-like phosphoesterase family protein
MQWYRVALGVFALLVVGCSESIPTAPVVPSFLRHSLTEPGSTLAWLAEYLSNPAAPVSGEPAVLAGAGDIARCYPGPNFRQYQRPGPAHPAQQTASLLDGMPGATIMAVGDNAYEFGSPLDYIGCYHPTWGRHRARTRPATGNHEYLTPGALGYFFYFGRAAAPPRGYYSYDLGGWHVVVLNSTPQVYLCWPPESDELPGFPPKPPPPLPDPSAGRACAGDALQQAWLVADLAAHSTATCTLAYFHHPRFSSGPHGNHYQMQRIWDILYAHGVDVVVSGHDHLYERFARQDPDANPNDVTGIRQFTVGTGGAEFYAVAAVQPNSQVIINTVHGVLALALDAGRYAWSFVAVDGSVRDSGEETCHAPPVL